MIGSALGKEDLGQTFSQPVGSVLGKRATRRCEFGETSQRSRSRKFVVA